MLSGIVWAIENPTRGIVEADEMDFERILEICMPYLGPVVGKLRRLDAARGSRAACSPRTSTATIRGSSRTSGWCDFDIWAKAASGRLLSCPGLIIPVFFGVYAKNSSCSSRTNYGDALRKPMDEGASV